MAQGGETHQDSAYIGPYPYILSPFLGGLGRGVTGDPGDPVFHDGGWHNARGISLLSGAPNDQVTQGGVGPIALPLLADFWTYPDSSELPEGNPFVASGYNGWQVSIPVRASPLPNYRPPESASSRRTRPGSSGRESRASWRPATPCRGTP